MTNGYREEQIIEAGQMTASDIVCLGMDAMRIAMGMRTINFDPDVVVCFIANRAGMEVIWPKDESEK